MKNPIILTGMEIATNADILNGTRLAAAPYPGVMTLMMQAADNVTANFFTANIALPGSEVPMDNQRVNGGVTAGLAGVIDQRTAMVISFFIDIGGNVLFSCIETGDTEFTWLARFAEPGV